MALSRTWTVFEATTPAAAWSRAADSLASTASGDPERLRRGQDHAALGDVDVLGVDAHGATLADDDVPGAEGPHAALADDDVSGRDGVRAAVSDRHRVRGCVFRVTGCGSARSLLLDVGHMGTSGSIE
jgi:hypothetical protein